MENHIDDVDGCVTIQADKSSAFLLERTVLKFVYEILEYTFINSSNLFAY